MVECNLTNDFGVFVQISLAVLAFITLVYKRHTEKPRRQWKIWGLDVSKQGISAVLAHFLNLLIAIIISERQAGDQCLWYFVTFMLDTTLGVLICYFLVKSLDDYFEKHNKISYKTGNYLVAVILRDEDINLTFHSSQSNQDNSNEKNNDSDNKINSSIQYQPGQLGTFLRIDIKIWAVQLLIWNLIVVISKIILFILTQIFSQFMLNCSQKLFQPIAQYPNLELFLIMFFIPITMNCFYFWMVDNFLKKQEITKIEEQLGIQKQLYEDQQVSNQINLVMSE